MAPRRSSYRRLALYGGALLGVSAGFAVQMMSSDDGRTLGSEVEAVESPTGEIVVIYVGAGDCSWCRVRGLGAAVRSVVAAFRAEAAALQQNFASIGVSADEDPAAGVEHLRSITAFTEIAAGRGWQNSALRGLIADGLVAMPATPQLFVVSRSVSDGVAIEGTDRLLASRLGAPEILGWRGGRPTLKELLGEEGFRQQ